MNSENVEEQFSPEESFAVIQKMIETAKNQYSENGHLYLLWGWIVLLCSVGQFVLLNIFHFQYHYIIWSLTWLAFAYQTYYLIKEKRRRRIRTYTDKIIGFVWFVFLILMLLFGVLFGSVLGDSYYKMVGPCFLALYGMPTFLSGIILRFRPLIIGGVACWILSIIALYTPSEFQLLLPAAAMLVAWIIPGYSLRARYKKANS